MRAIRSFFAGLLVAGASAAMPAAAQQSQPPAPPQATTEAMAVLDSLAKDPNGITLGGGDLAPGPRTIGAKDHIAGSAGSWHGPLTVLGTVDGNAIALGGDVIIGKGARVRGDAFSLGGTVINQGGTVDGEMRSISALTVGKAGRPPLTRAQTMRRSISLSTGWFLVLALIGLGALIVARPNLESVADAVRVQTVRAFVVGLLTQLGIVPAFVLAVVACVITVIGIIAVPFVVVGAGAAVAGALALGFLASALLAGEALSGPRNGDSSFTAMLQPLLIGLVAFLALWVLGTAFPWAGGIGIALRMLATLITWMAVTTGLGAVVLTRAGARTVVPPSQIAPAPVAELEWQTPTPVTGVAAARRPTPAPRQGAGGAR